MKTAGSNLQTPIRKPCSLNHYMCYLKKKQKKKTLLYVKSNPEHHKQSHLGIRRTKHDKKMTPQKRGAPKKHLYILTHPSHLHRC